MFRFARHGGLHAAILFLSLACSKPTNNDEQPVVSASPPVAPTPEQYDSMQAALDSADAQDYRRRKASMGTVEDCIKQAAGLPEATRRHVEERCRTR